MLPLILMGVIWGYNGVRFLQLRNSENSLKESDPKTEEDHSLSEEGKSLTIHKDCTFEDKRTHRHYHNCTFNIIKGSKDKEGLE